MKAKLGRSETDNTMIELTTVHHGRTILWAIIHEDFLSGEDIELDFNQNNCLNIEIVAK